MSLRLPEDKTQPGTVSYDALRWGLGKLAAERGHWAGLPMPLNGARLVIEPSFPNAAALMSIGEKHGPHEDHGLRLRNRWYSRKHSCDIFLMDTPEGKVDWGRLPACHHLNQDLQTLWCTDAWGMEQECKAVDLLESLVTPRQFKQYILTGMFLEKSNRSGVTYMFRRLKPTVAIKSHFDTEEMRILCSLCLHPIGHYADSWSGVMCPSDDIVGHLMLMRGDEHHYWKSANQIPPHRPEAGL